MGGADGEKMSSRQPLIGRRAALRALGIWGTGVTAVASGMPIIPAGQGLAPAVASAAQAPEPADLDVQASALLTSLLYRDPAAPAHGMTAAGAAGANAQWERGERAQWFIEEQRVGEIS